MEIHRRGPLTDLLSDCIKGPRGKVGEIRKNDPGLSGGRMWVKKMWVKMLSNARQLRYYSAYPLLNKPTDDSGLPDPLNVPRDPLIDKSMLRMRHILTLVDRCPITSAYRTFFQQCLKLLNNNII